MRISSFRVPIATTLSACVCPRVNSAEPCVRGVTPTSIEMSRISFSERPSGRFLLTAMRSRMIDFSSLSKAICAAARFCLAATSWSSEAPSGAAGPYCSMISASTALVASWRSSLSSTCVAASSWEPCEPRISSSSFLSTAIVSKTFFSLPTLLARSRCIAQSFLISAWAMSSASRISASGISLAPASTIRIASSVPATIRSRSEGFSASASRSGSFGLTTKLPSTLPIRTAPTGVGSGMSEIISAAEAPFIARMS